MFHVLHSACPSHVWLLLRLQSRRHNRNLTYQSKRSRTCATFLYSIVYNNNMAVDPKVVCHFCHIRVGELFLGFCKRIGIIDPPLLEAEVSACRRRGAESPNQNTLTNTKKCPLCGQRALTMNRQAYTLLPFTIFHTKRTTSPTISTGEVMSRIHPQSARLNGATLNIAPAYVTMTT